MFYLILIVLLYFRQNLFQYSLFESKTLQGRLWVRVNARTTAFVFFPHCVLSLSCVEK